MQLNQRQKNILLSLVSNEIDDHLEDIEIDERYLNELENLAGIIFNTNLETDKK